jgi:hypothetical protein
MSRIRISDEIEHRNVKTVRGAQPLIHGKFLVDLVDNCFAHHLTVARPLARSNAYLGAELWYYNAAALTKAQRSPYTLQTAGTTVVVAYGLDAAIDRLERSQFLK